MVGITQLSTDGEDAFLKLDLGLVVPINALARLAQEPGTPIDAVKLLNRLLEGDDLVSLEHLRELVSLLSAHANEFGGMRQIRGRLFQYDTGIEGLASVHALRAVYSAYRSDFLMGVDLYDIGFNASGLTQPVSVEFIDQAVAQKRAAFFLRPNETLVVESLVLNGYALNIGSYSIGGGIHTHGAPVIIDATYWPVRHDDGELWNVIHDQGSYAAPRVGALGWNNSTVRIDCSSSSRRDAPFSCVVKAEKGAESAEQSGWSLSIRNTGPALCVVVPNPVESVFRETIASVRAYLLYGQAQFNDRNVSY